MLFRNEAWPSLERTIIFRDTCLFGSRRDIEFAKFAEFSSIAAGNGRFRGLPLQTNSAHGHSMRVTQRVNCRFVTRKAVQPTEDAITNYECTFYEAASLPSRQLAR